MCVYENLDIKKKIKKEVGIDYYITSTDVLPSKNQALCEYCTHVSNY